MPGDEDVVTRRAPFSDNPDVGARGQRTQQRIVDAALVVFGEQGYHQCSVHRITTLAGCSRVSFYQYFSSKEDLFRHLTGQVARQLSASTEALTTVTADAAGREALRAWIERRADIYEHYEPVFHAFAAAAESDEVVADGSVRVSRRHVKRVTAKLETVAMPPRQLEPLVGLLVETINRTLDSAGVLRVVAPETYARSRIVDTLADVWHRTLFGLQPDRNVTPPIAPPPPTIEFVRAIEDRAHPDGRSSDLSAAGQRTLDALLLAGREVFASRGYHRARVDDIVEVAGVSHGAFYRYFDNKDALAQAVALRAIVGLSAAFVEIPGAFDAAGRPVPATASLRAWLRSYGEANAAEAAILRVWLDASRQDPSLGHESAAVLDWGRRRLARFLHPRDFGDPALDAVVMLSLLSAFTSRQRDRAALDAATTIVERALLGR